MECTPFPLLWPRRQPASQSRSSGSLRSAPAQDGLLLKPVSRSTFRQKRRIRLRTCIHPAQRYPRENRFPVSAASGRVPTDEMRSEHSFLDKCRCLCRHAQHGYQSSLGGDQLLSNCVLDKTRLNPHAGQSFQNIIERPASVDCLAFAVHHIFRPSR
jgi:hypothetical protein